MKLNEQQTIAAHIDALRALQAVLHDHDMRIGAYNNHIHIGRSCYYMDQIDATIEHLRKGLDDD